MSRQHRVVWFDDTSRQVGGRVHLKTYLTLLAVVDSNTFKNERTETRTSTASYSVVNNKPLHVVTVVNKLSQTVIDLIQNFFSHGVVTTREVVGGIFLSVKQELGMKHLSVVAITDIINHRGFQVHGDLTRYILTGAGLFEEGCEVLV